MKAHPGITLDLRLSDTEFDLIEGSYDVALRNMELQDSSLMGRKLADDTRVLCASPEYLSTSGGPAHPRDLVEHQLIAFKDLNPRLLVGPGGAKTSFDPRGSRSRLINDDGLSQKIATLNGAGMSLNSLWSVHQELRSGQLVRVLPDWTAEAQSALWLVYPQSNAISVKVRVFIGFLLKSPGNVAEWASP